jgi:hypothetical protein
MAASAKHWARPMDSLAELVSVSVVARTAAPGSKHPFVASRPQQGIPAIGPVFMMSATAGFNPDSGYPKKNRRPGSPVEAAIESGQRCPAQGTAGFSRRAGRNTFALARKGNTYKTVKLAYRPAATGVSFQISALYSSMVRSVENLPLAAVLMMLMRVQRSRSR